MRVVAKVLDGMEVLVEEDDERVEFGVEEADELLGFGKAEDAQVDRIRLLWRLFLRLSGKKRTGVSETRCSRLGRLR